MTKPNTNSKRWRAHTRRLMRLERERAQAEYARAVEEYYADYHCLPLTAAERRVVQAVTR